MKNILAFTAAVALVAIGTTQAQTQTTNLVQQLDVRLLGYEQGATTTNGNTIRSNVTLVKVDTKTIISALGAATGNTFSNKSRLVLITPVTGSNSTVEVRTGTNSVDVTGFFILEQISGSVVSSQHNTKTGRSSSSTYSIERLVLQDSGKQTLTLHFDVTGLLTESSAAGQSSGNSGECRDRFDRDEHRGGGHHSPQVIEAQGNVTGSGDQNGSLLILQGAISIEGNTLEVITTGGSGGGSGGNPT